MEALTGGPIQLVFLTFQGNADQYLVKTPLGEFTVVLSGSGMRLLSESESFYLTLPPERLIVERHEDG